MSSPSVFQVYKKLLKTHGEQNWWPGDSPFEIMVGAILTQNTSWTNVEKAIENLKSGSLLDAKKIEALPHEKLAEFLRPVGYFNVKATRLKNFCHWYLKQHNLEQTSTLELRARLLDINGVGPETADDILLYAFARPVFVIDAYTRRLFQRLGLLDGEVPYEELRLWFEKKLNHCDNKVGLFNEFHALIVHHAKYYCSTRPRCEGCCLDKNCQKLI